MRRKTATFFDKIEKLGQKRKKKVLAFYVNRIYTDKQSGAKWSRIPDITIEVGER